MQKSKNKEVKTEAQEFTEQMAEKMSRRMVIHKGRICFSDDLESPLNVLARGHAGLPGRHGRDGRNGIDGIAGVDATGKRGLRGLDGQSATGPIGRDGPVGAKGDTAYPEMRFEGTKLCIGKLSPVDLRGPAGPVGPAGRDGRDGKSETGATGPAGVCPAELIEIVTTLDELKARIAKLEKDS